MQFKLTTREKSELFGEGIATVILLLLLNMSIFVIANQEREKSGLENPVVHDTDKAIKVAVEAVRELIRADKEQEKRK